MSDDRVIEFILRVCDVDDRLGSVLLSPQLRDAREDLRSLYLILKRLQPMLFEIGAPLVVEQHERAREIEHAQQVQRLAAQCMTLQPPGGMARGPA